MNRLLPIAIFVVSAHLSGCISTGGSGPSPSPGFVPKKEYPVTLEKIWSAATAAIEKERILIATSSMQDGRITTDYIQGGSSFQLAFSQTQHTRYKYSISFAKKDDAVTRMQIVCGVEVSYDKKDSSSQWRDVSKDNVKLTTSLENWLYEQIEKGL